ncbi:hypothetical protein AB0F88_37705 [Streptosporangium sp. NPDC023963]|uniref:hypothetical protein n=1 Tax=Streptosporangium sp. NPDC023963 TaxID=3155608 RepID=UPI0034244350
MGRDDIQGPYEEDPREQTGPLGPAQYEPERPAGDVLSDGWNEIDFPELTPGDGSQVIVHVDGSREIVRADGSREMVYLDERREIGDTDITSDGPLYREEDEAAPSRGFLGSGWREDPDPYEERRRRGRSKSRILLAVVGGVVIAGVAGGWLLSASLDGETGTTCAPGARCSVADLPQVPSETPTPRPEEKTAEPSDEPSTADEPPTTAPTRAPRTQEPSTRPSPTRSTSPRETRPTASSEDAEQEETSPQDSSPNSRITSEPAPSPTSQAPTETATPSQEPTTAPPPQDSGTNDNSGDGRGGLLDWLF